MKRVGLLVLSLTLAGAGALAAHDLFFRPAEFFVGPNSDVAVHVLNGTFSKSEAVVARDRIRDLTIVSPVETTHPDTSQWTARRDTSVLQFRAGPAGTYLIGASTLPRGIRLTGKQFSEYLASDGVPDILEARKRAGETHQPAHERYSKHIKTLLQVGEARTAGFDAVLEYPAELVPLENPYSLKPGAVLRLKTLVDGRPMTNQFVVAGGRTREGGRFPLQEVRSDSGGVVRIVLGQRGYWYVKFIHMVAVSGDSVNYESKWASLTFQLR